MFLHCKLCGYFFGLLALIKQTEERKLPNPETEAKDTDTAVYASHANVLSLSFLTSPSYQRFPADQ